jgi:hypothetical protein
LDIMPDFRAVVHLNRARRERAAHPPTGRRQDK